jgi:hypothetical protein
MNAPNPQVPESRSLSEPTLEHLRRAIHERRASPAAGDAALQAALEVVAVEARDRAMRPEELIVALKQVMDEVRAPRSTSSDERHLREWVVTTCIKAYFSQ